MTARLEQVHVRGIAPERLEPFIGIERAEAFAKAAGEARALLDGRVVLNVNSTASGGGVAELLQTLLAYARGAGVDAQWAVIKGNPRFFEITKRLHNHLYGTPGDGGPLGDAERHDYDERTRHNADAVASMARPGDIVVLHDPQTAGLAQDLQPAGVRVVWRCHIGVDVPNEYSEVGWNFLRPYLEDLSGYVVSCARFAPEWIPRDRLTVIAPSIDPFSAKNEQIEPDDVVATLQRVGVLAGPAPESGAEFTRRDGTRSRVGRPVDMVGTGPGPTPDVPVVLQASRWDTLKDMPGVMVGFADRITQMSDAHLILAGPEAIGVADDPEAVAVLDDCRAIWQRLPTKARTRIHLVCVPMADPDEAAAVVNALQRHATVVVQKSLAEGFGLTVAEAMWKGRPVVGSAVGGITDQIVSDNTGWLLEDPLDLDHYAKVIEQLLADRDGAARLGANGRERARLHFLADRHLSQWGELFAQVVDS